MPSASVHGGRRGRPSPAPRPRISGAGSALEHGDRAAPGPGRRRHLEADEPGADDDHPGRAVGDHARGGRAQSSSVRSSWTVGHGSWPGSRRVRRAGGDDQPVERHDAVVGQVHATAARRRRGRWPARRAGGRARASSIAAAGAARSARRPSRRPAASSTAAGGRRAGAARRRSA